jgi:preprotein translocase subunit SecD
VVQKLDLVANTPYPPANLSWAAINALYNKETQEKRIPLRAVNARRRPVRRYGLSLIAAVLVIGLVVFGTNAIWGNVLGGSSAATHMQLAVVENGIVPSSAVMKNAVTILSTRFRQFGLNGSHVSWTQTSGQSVILITLPFFGSNEQSAVDKLLEPGKIGFWDTGTKVLPRGTSFNPKDYAQYNPGDQPRFTNQDLNLDSLFVSQRLGTSDYTIGFTMQNEAISRFAQFTGSHLGDAMTITLDGKVLMSALIDDGIPDGSAGIASDFTLQQANAIVAALKSGVLPVELKKIS